MKFTVILLHEARNALHITKLNFHLYIYNTEQIIISFYLSYHFWLLQFDNKKIFALAH